MGGVRLAQEIDVLRAFRDTFLLSNGPGTAFVDFYYRCSPPIARIVAQWPLLAGAVRIALLPMVLFAYVLLTAPGLALLSILACALVGRKARLRLRSQR